MVRDLETEAVQIHRSAVTVLRGISSCTVELHGLARDAWLCENCSTELGECHSQVGTNNSTLGRFLNSVESYSESNASFTIHAVLTLSILFEKRLAVFEDYLNNLSSKMHISPIQY